MTMRGDGEERSFPYQNGNEEHKKTGHFEGNGYKGMLNPNFFIKTTAFESTFKSSLSAREFHLSLSMQEGPTSGVRGRLRKRLPRSCRFDVRPVPLGYGG